MGMGESLIRARGLVKRFGGFTAVNGIDVDVWKGEAFGFLGPNGAGKSSTMRMVGCVSPPSGGELTILGMDPRRDGPAIRARLGVCPQEDNLDVELTARENLTTYARYFGIPRKVARRRADELLEFVQLDERADSKVEPLSGGMKRRLTIARALVNEPEIMLLDEPTTGLDPRGRLAMWDITRRLAADGTSVLLTTQYLDEADQLADRVAVLNHGRVVAEGPPRELKARVGGARLQLRPQTAGHGQAVATAVAGWSRSEPQVDPDSGEVTAVVDPDPGLLSAALGRVAELDLALADIALHRPALDDVFLSLTGPDHQEV